MCFKYLGESVLDNESDDEGEPNTYDYDDSFLNDDGDAESSGSYGNDDSDSDFDPNTKSDMEDDDVSCLVDEAKEFISNKKNAEIGF